MPPRPIVTGWRPLNCPDSQGAALEATDQSTVWGTYDLAVTAARGEVASRVVPALRAEEARMSCPPGCGKDDGGVRMKWNIPEKPSWLWRYGSWTVSATGYLTVRCVLQEEMESKSETEYEGDY